MSDLEQRRGAGLSRRTREQRAYRLVLATGAGALATVGLLVLSVVGIVSFGLVLLVGLVTAGLALWLRSTLRP